MEDQSIVQMAWFAPAVFSEQQSIVAQVLNGYLRIRLNNEIRENLGGVYSIGASVGVSAAPRGEMSMRIQFACNPRRVEELSSAVLDLLAGIAAGVNRPAFDSAVEALHQSLETSMQSNAFIASSYVNSSVMLNQPLSRLQRRPGYFDAVTPADIQRFAAQLLANGPAKVVLFSGE